MACFDIAASIRTSRQPLTKGTFRADFGSINICPLFMKQIRLPEWFGKPDLMSNFSPLGQGQGIVDIYT